MAEQSVQPQGYQPRIVDTQIERYLRIFGAVEIAGTKWCGKTWAARQHGASITYVDRDNNLQIAHADPSLMLLGEQPHIIDEWQLAPAIWDEVRHQVDDNSSRKGQWILTGSSTPLFNKLPNHSGSGRIGRIKMHPMTLAESGLSTQTVSLQGLFNHEFTPAQQELPTQQLFDAVCRGGWPETQHMPVEDAQIIIREYIRLTLEHSFATHQKNTDIARRLLQSLARNVGQAQTYKTLGTDMFGADAEETGFENFISTRSIAEYLELFQHMFVIDEIPGWVPAARSPKRLRTKPKRYFADPSIAATVLGMTSGSLLNDWQTFGLLFENLVIRDLQVYAQSLPQTSDVPVRYYHDDSDLECDAIIELTDGRWAGIEIKVSHDKVDQAAENLLRLRRKLVEHPKSQTREPEFLAVIIGVGKFAYQREDGVYVIPLGTLSV
ncbi:ATPase AAA [Galliscardovia ingluviei]|uniref:ATPase AAA n=1 Tax=Galliscardovia ingluviei TaxID=1769422 RepID=A0A8J3AGR5_9BIFI|nr:DUF4143 domain-containing protein [Galliscardovia ingluviei]GGI14083.1 ATPase AAA [Galliscardovia ingluviei]